jgi:hypothetical protein
LPGTIGWARSQISDKSATIAQGFDCTPRNRELWTIDLRQVSQKLPFTYGYAAKKQEMTRTCLFMCDSLVQKSPFTTPHLRIAFSSLKAAASSTLLPSCAFVTESSGGSADVFTAERVKCGYDKPSESGGLFFVIEFRRHANKSIAYITCVSRSINSVEIES